MTRTQIYLPEEMLMQIKLEAQMKGMKMSELIRELLQQGFKTRPKKRTKNNGLKAMIGKYKSGGFDCNSSELSKKIDETVYILPHDKQ